MIEFRLPSLGSDMDQGTLLQWQVQVGDAVRKGQVIAVVDTAKAAIDVECWHDGVVHALRVEPGEKIPVGRLMAVLRSAGESAADVERQLAAPPAPARPAPTAVGQAVTVAAAPLTAVMAPRGEGGERRKVSPIARRRATELGLDLDAIPGTGPQGAVTLADVEGRHGVPPAIALKPAAPALTRAQEMRRVIAAAMARSKREIPHYYLAEDVAFERATQWLAERNRDRAPAERLLPAALQLKAVACALLRYPEFNGFWKDDGFVAAPGIHLGVAISLRQGGLVAPALHDVPGMDIAALTRAVLDLVKRTRAGALRSSELSDASLTVTNLGDQGVDSVFGVIYPPQVALVGFGRMRLRPWADESGVRALPVVTASLAADHRTSDGHRGALFLAALGELLQDPQALDAPAMPPTEQESPP
jgi:pyruvate dehydrogenase E2 component (dihydrolipoamide acetyltransferase)